MSITQELLYGMRLLTAGRRWAQIELYAILDQEDLEQYRRVLGQEGEAEIRMKGRQALIGALGLVDAEHFMVAASPDRFNYTEWRRLVSACPVRTCANWPTKPTLSAGTWRHRGLNPNRS